MTFLDDIREEKEQILAVKKERRSLINAIGKARAEGRNPVIAEIKRSSPTLNQVRTLDAAETAKKMVVGGACAVSVLTEERHFAGSIDDLRTVRRAVDLPVLAKDFHLDDYHVYEAYVTGADAVLLIARLLPPERLEALTERVRGLGMEPLIEIDTAYGPVKNIEETLGFLRQPTLVGVNCRDLATLDVDPDAFKQVAPLIDERHTLIAMSGIAKPEDAHERFSDGADAVLIGTAVMDAYDIEATVRSFAEAPP